MNSRSSLVIVMSLCFSKSPKYKMGLLPYSMLSLIIKGIFSIHKFVKLIYFSPVVLYTPPNYFQIYIYLFIYLFIIYQTKVFYQEVNHFQNQYNHCIQEPGGVVFICNTSGHTEQLHHHPNLFQTLLTELSLFVNWNNGHYKI